MNCDGARHDWPRSIVPAPCPLAVNVLRQSLEQARTSENQYAQNENHYMKLALDARTSREKYATKAAELGQAIAQLGGVVERVAA